MEISSILNPDAVRVISHVSSKKRLFQNLGGVVADCCGVNPEQAVEALQERENLGPTGVGHGVALPHARIEGLNHVVGAFLRLENPLDFQSADRMPVDLVFALFAPKESGVEHLKALATVSRTMRDAAICGKLRANTNETALHALLTEHRIVKAA